MRDWPRAVLFFFFHARRFDHEPTDGVPVPKCSSHDTFGQAADSQERQYYLFSLYHYHLSFCAKIDLMRNLIYFGSDKANTGLGLGKS